MALFKRGPDKPETVARSGGPEAVYARTIDGEHLWLAVRGRGPLVLRGDGVQDLEVPTEAGADAEGPLVTARFPIATALADVPETEVELRLYAGRGVNAAPVTHAAAAPEGPGLAEPPTRDRRWQFEVGSADGEVVVHRRALPMTVEALAFASTDAGVEILLNTEVDHAELVVDGAPVAQLPIDDSVLRLADLPALAAGATAGLLVRGGEVVRSGNTLDRPMAAVALPPLLEPDVTLRWTPEARLAIRREDVS